MYVKIINSVVEQYPFYIQSLKQQNRHISFPDNIESDYESLKQYNVYKVYETDKPKFNVETQKVVEVNPVLINGMYFQSWQVVDLSDEEKDIAFKSKSDEVKAERNRLLVESDWTQYKDIDQEVSLKWQPYRQALRDITKQPRFPWEVSWPVI